MSYNLNKPHLSLDIWQKNIIEEKGNVIVRAGRQVGKSTAIAIKAGEYALNNPKKQVLIIASVERQAHLLFEKVITYLEDSSPNAIKKGRDRPTKSKLSLKNGSVIRSLPTGLSGTGIRGYTIDLLIADEAAFIPQEVWVAVTPMLAITKGKIILLSTPFGKEGYFYDRYKDPTFKKFHVSSEDCPRKDEHFLTEEKKRMTKLQYAQEYLGEFVDELMQFFPTTLIQRAMRLKRPSMIDKTKRYYLGVDVARLGTDESTFEIVDMSNRKKIRHIENIITTKTYLTETTRKIIELEKLYDFKKIYIDDGGVGSGVFDPLLEVEETRRKVIAINNAARALDKDEKRKKKLLKEDLYNNLLRLMERGEIALLSDDEIFLSLKSVQYEYTDEGNIKIYGKYTHICEGLVRAAWGTKDKTLNIYCA